MFNLISFEKKIDLKLYIIFFIFLLNSCSTIWEGTESKIYLKMPLNTRVFDKDSNEIEIKAKKDTIFYVELKSSEVHELLFINDNKFFKINLEPKLSPFWVGADVLTSINFIGFPLLLDYFLGSWYRFDEINLNLENFKTGDINLSLIENAGKRNQNNKQPIFARNTLYGDLLDWDYMHYFGMNYEYSVQQGLLFNQSALNLRGGIYGFLDKITALNVGPALLIGDEHKIEFFLGVIFDFYPPKQNSKALPNSIKNGISLGYRYQPIAGGIIFRIGYLPFIYINNNDNALYKKTYGSLYISFGGAW